MANKLLLTKIIYPGSKAKTVAQVEEILWLEVETHLRNNPELGFVKSTGLEVETHLRNNPELGFVKSTGPENNNDLTHTYKLEFTQQEVTGGAQGIDAKPIEQ